MIRSGCEGEQQSIGISLQLYGSVQFTALFGLQSVIIYSET